MSKKTKSPTPGQVLSIALAELVAGYQDKLARAINNQQYTQGERDGLRIASAIFSAELGYLGITNPVISQPADTASVANARYRLANGLHVGDVTIRELIAEIDQLRATATAKTQGDV